VSRFERPLTLLTRLLVGATIATVAMSLTSLPTTPLASFVPTPAFATPNCLSSQQKHKFDGWSADAEGGWGAQAWIVAQVATLCNDISGTYNPGDFGNGTSAWALLGPQDNQQLAQAGFIWLTGQSQALYFTEWQDASCPYQQSGGLVYSYCMRTWGSVANGQNDHYQIFAASDNHIDMAIDGSVVGRTSYVANCSNDWCGPWGQEWNGEAADPGNSMPGSFNNRTNFTTVQYEPSLGGSWAAPPSQNVTINHDTPDSPMLYCQIQQTSQSFNIFTSYTYNPSGCG